VLRTARRSVQDRSRSSGSDIAFGPGEQLRSGWRGSEGGDKRCDE
jgi:hypothetical protein